jgi:[ribosomal protein S5]-alanine N-acetyltransferase
VRRTAARSESRYGADVASDQHDHTPILTGLGLTLRGVVAGDVATIRSISYYDGRAAIDDDDAAEMLRRIHGDVARGESLHWGICLQGSDEVTGTVGFYRGFAGGVGEIGYVLREAYRGRGIMTRAVRIVVAYGLGPLGLTRIEARTASDNAASRALLLRAGFVEAGVVQDGGAEDQVRYVVAGA